MSLETFIEANFMGIATLIIIPILMFYLSRRYPTLTEKTAEKESQEKSETVKLELLTNKLENYAVTMEKQAEKSDERTQEWKKKFEKSENKRLEDLSNNNKRFHEIQIDLEKLKKEVSILSDYKEKYYEAVDWIKDVCNIAKREAFKLPYLSSRIINDISSQKNRNYTQEALDAGNNKNKKEK